MFFFHGVSKPFFSSYDWSKLYFILKTLLVSAGSATEAAARNAPPVTIDK
jgi:hypothetical protein